MQLGSASDPSPSSHSTWALPVGGTGETSERPDVDAEAVRRAEDAAQECLNQMDKLWEELTSSIAFVIPLLKEVRSTR